MNNLIRISRSKHGETFCLRGSKINVAEQKKSSYDDYAFFIQDDSLPSRCIELHMPKIINKSTDEEVMQIEQSVEAENFLVFFTNQFSKPEKSIWQ